VTTWEAMARDYLGATHRRRLVIPIPLPGRTFREIRAGAFLPPEEAVAPKAAVVAVVTGEALLIPVRLETWASIEAVRA
jgi:hypothetical protein